MCIFFGKGISTSRPPFKSESRVDRKELAMAPEFLIPHSLQDLENADYDLEHLYVQTPLPVDRLSPAESEDLVKELVFELADKDVTCTVEQNIFDRLYSLVKGFTSLLPPVKRNLIESLCSNFSVLIPSIASVRRSVTTEVTDDAAFTQQQVYAHRNALKIYSYFLSCIFVAEEAAESNREKAPAASQKGKQVRKKHLPPSWNWETLRTKIIILMETALESDLQQLYGMSLPEEGLLAFFAKFGLKLLEIQAILKEKETKEALCRYIAACAMKYNYVEQLVPSLVGLLHKYEHLPVHVADIIAFGNNKYHDNKLAVAVLREIGSTNPKDYVHVASSADNVGCFLSELTDRLPKLMVTNLSMLMPHFGGESYKFRNALVTMLGKLIVKAFRDPDSNPANDTLRIRNKQAMLDVLIERVRDTTAYTRNRVLQTWIYLCEEHALSIGLWNPVAEIAAGRLEDKAVIVRKSSLQLLATLLQYNPFGPQLRTSVFEATLDKYKEKLENMTQNTASTQEAGTNPEDLAAQNTVETARVEGVSVVGDEQQSQYEDSGPSQMPVNNGYCVSDVGGIEQTRALVASLEAGLRFSKTMALAMPIVLQLLSSPAVTDVNHAIEFLTCCRQFNIDGSESAFRKTLPLAFSQEKGIYEAVETAFIKAYMKQSPQETVQNLLKLILEAPIGDLACTEALLCNLMKKQEIPSNMVTRLWEVFTFNVNGVTPEQSRGALMLLCMIANCSPQIMSFHIQNVIDIGFGRWAKDDMLLARFACVALQRLSNEDKASMQPNHKIFSILSSLIIGQALPEQSWYAAAEQAINALYALHPMPEAFSANLLSRFFRSVFVRSEHNGRNHATSNDSTAECCDQQSIPTYSTKTLGRFLFVVGHVALKHLVYIEACVKAVRKNRADKERTMAEATAANAMQESETSLKENITAELGLAASEDLKLDILLDTAEQEIVSGKEHRKFLIGTIAPFVAKLCRNSKLLLQSPQLRISALLCLCKLMAIDANYCEKNLQLLFTAAQNCMDDLVRSNCIISLGDLAFRFPNLLEPWTGHIYARLQDKSTAVRKNAALVISHLILNDMMKVKGHISEMALLLHDEDPRISNLVRLFFHELSKKGNNPIYSLLPDMLSRLSSMKGLSKEIFHAALQFLIGYIKKERQMEGLIEKLCNRFTGTADRRHWHALSYCLSQLAYSDKAIKKLTELFKQFENALVDDEVTENFKMICSKTKKLAKPDLKCIIEEFEEKMMKCHQEKKEQELAAYNAESHQEAHLVSADIEVAHSVGDEEEMLCNGNDTSAMSSPATDEAKENNGSLPSFSGNMDCNLNHSASGEESDADSTVSTSTLRSHSAIPMDHDKHIQKPKREQQDQTVNSSFASIAERQKEGKEPKRHRSRAAQTKHVRVKDDDADDDISSVEVDTRTKGNGMLLARQTRRRNRIAQSLRLSSESNKSLSETSSGITDSYENELKVVELADVTNKIADTCSKRFEEALDNDGPCKLNHSPAEKVSPICGSMLDNEDL